MDPTTDDKTPAPAPGPAEAVADVAGHSFGGAILGTAIAGSSGRQRKPEQRPSDEALPPLTKPFPSMREQKPK
jgi:hypothetical protein